MIILSDGLFLKKSQQLLNFCTAGNALLLANKKYKESLNHEIEILF